MNDEQAILILTAYRDKLTSSCSNQLDEDIEAFNMGIAALNKSQTRKIQHSSWIYGMDEIMGSFVQCPECDTQFPPHFREFIYCPICGERLRRE